ncbi:hypothetical protein LOC54_11720 [Acetobacter sp. AN02]|uniref:hypothetical protein n=1 Tax=Acetobacter sp. AN02 TaxID=2894186 RepID=UPI0024341DDB|nr:hypothetical protein [Acetobacter sp. AN02]MDG6095740.1 hypothetical protein [Acetobacter sp. AN02]
MMRRPGDPQPDPKSVLRGIMLLGTGRQEGITCFRSTIQTFLAALAPGVALNIIAALTGLMSGHRLIALTRVSLSLCAFLAPPVISHALAKYWKKEDLWLRYATAALWCDWLQPVVMVLTLLLASLLTPSLVGQQGLAAAVVIVSGLYSLWLMWFVARTGLAVSKGQAALLCIANILFILACYGVATLLSAEYNFLRELILPSSLRRG